MVNGALETGEVLRIIAADKSHKGKDHGGDDGKVS